MKLWRKLAKNGNGRKIKQMAQIQEMIFKKEPKGYPLLDALLKRSGMTFVLSKNQQAALKSMIERANEQTAEEPTNEAQ